MNWFDIDKEGLARLLERKGKAFAVLELIQNSWDEASTLVEVTLVPDGRGKATLTVTDDNPEGFKFIEHAYTLFADSTKKDDPSKRGRFNLGEKLFLAVCDEATIWTTKGLVIFDSTGRSYDKKDRREAGTKISATIRLNKLEQAEVGRLIWTLLPPAHITTVFNSETVEPREAARVFQATLPTEKADAEGILRPTRRLTDIEIFHPRDGEKPHIYEMGIPVCEQDGKYHVNVLQKVPLNFNRDNVTPAYLKQLREAVLNNTFDLLDQEEAHKPWVADALPKANDSAFKKVVAERFGDRVAIYDPSCPEANQRAVEQGYTVIHGRQLPQGSFGRMREMGVARPTGQHQEFRGDIPTSPDGKPPIPRDKWTPGMKRVAAYAVQLAEALIGELITVDIYSIATAGWDGAFGKQDFLGMPLGSTLLFNVGRLGHAWFDNPDQEKIDALLIHEFAHAKAENHKDDAFYHECCRLGAKIRTCKTIL